MTLISIIVPTFNSQKTIGTSLQSVLDQTFQDYEILVVDGLSTDNTLEIVREKKDNRITIISEKDFGTYDAINKGVKKSNGKWIYILGSDDNLYNTDVLKNISKKLFNTNSLLLYGNVKINGNPGWSKDGDIYFGEFNLQKILKGNISQQAVFYNKNLFENIGLFNTKYFVCADWDFLLRVVSKHEIEYVDLIVADFYAGGISTTKKDIDFAKDFISNLVCYFGFYLGRKEFLKFNNDIKNYTKSTVQNRKYAIWVKLKLILFIQSINKLFAS